MGKPVVVELSEELRNAPRSEQEKAINEEVERFSKYMAGIQTANGPVRDGKAFSGELAPFEKAMVKSYLVYRVTQKDEVG